jgi:hypothetical protein
MISGTFKICYFHLVTSSISFVSMVLAMDESFKFFSKRALYLASRVSHVGQLWYHMPSSIDTSKKKYFCIA